MIEILQQHGLSEREANVYITGLSLGSVPSSTIARHTQENRITVYSILKELVKKGFFSTITRDGVKYFAPIPPKVLLKKMEQKYLDFKENIPLLLSVVESNMNKPRLTYYEGIEGIKNLYNEILHSKQPLYAFLSDAKIDPILEKYLNTTFINTRKNHNIHASVIVSPNKDTDNYRNIIGDNDPLTTIKIAPMSLSGLQGEIILFDSKYIACALYSKKEMIGFLVESEQFYKSLHLLFNFVWNNIPGKNE